MWLAFFISLFFKTTRRTKEVTVIILDIDGVLNPFGARHNTELGFTWLERDNTGVFLKPDLHVPWIERLSEHATFVWGSAWGEGSNLLLELLGLDGQWGWIPLDRDDVGLGTWKLKSVKPWVDALPAGERVVWLDDELESDVFDWVEKRGNMLAVCPDRYEGLTEADFQRVYDFVIA